jgi:hypothetical protein
MAFLFTRFLTADRDVVLGTKNGTMLTSRKKNKNVDAKEESIKPRS